MSAEEGIAELVHDYPSSIELNRGMKGDVGWSIKIRGADGDEMVLVARIHEIDDELTARFKTNLEQDLVRSVNAERARKSIDARVIDRMAQKAEASE